MTAVKISKAYDPIEIDLWGAKFETVDQTRGATKKAQEITADVNRLKAELPHGGDADELVNRIGDGLDLRLQALDGGRKKPSTLLKARWKDDKISLGRIFEFLAEIPTAELLSGLDDDDEDEGRVRPS